MALNPHPESESSQKSAHSLFRLHNAVMKAMSACFCLLFVAVSYFVIPQLSYQTPAKIAAKKLNIQRYEDYTFEGVLSRAKEECSYMSLANDTVIRNRTLQIVKEKIAEKALEKFYKQKEKEKQEAKEYYEKIEKQSRRRAMSRGRPPWDFAPPRPFPPPLALPPPPVLRQRHLQRRSAASPGRRRKGSSPFSEVSFTDHNNCSSRCLFAQMEMVDSYGFPEESLITKLIEDRIQNRKMRLVKTKKVATCFKKMEEVAFDDSCIFSSKLFDCLDFDEQYS